VLKVFVTPGYFDAIGMTLLSGRAFDDRDGEIPEAPPLLVNESFVRQYWPWAAPGKVLGKGVRGGGTKDWMRIVGVVKDDRHYGLEQPPRPTVFLPYRAGAVDIAGLTIVIRTLAAPESLVSSSRRLLREADPDLPMFDVQTMTERVNQSLWARRGYSWLVAVFAAVALVLAAAGVYGVVSYAVNQRTREIGIRMALGARPGQVMRGVLTGGMMFVMGGAAAGLAVMWMAVRVMRELLFGIDGKDPIIYGAVVAGIAAVGFCANWFPARRAATVDPMRALHAE
jgi:hypothetical protein